MSVMTSAWRARIKKEIDALAREHLDDERVLFCSTCFQPYDKTRHGTRKLCGCNPTKGLGRRRKAASPAVA